MSRPVLVFGHRNPDADAICAALAYAEYKNRTGSEPHQAARCGNSNARIDAILDHFGVQLPTFIGDVTPRLKDQMASDLVTLGIDGTAAEALELLDRHGLRALPVVGDGRSLAGVLSIHQLGQSFLPRVGAARDVRRVETNLAAIARVLQAEVLHMERGDEIQSLYIRVAAMALASFDDLQQREGIHPDQTIVVVGDREDIQRHAIGLGVRLLVLSGNRTLSPAVLDEAREAGVAVFRCAYDSASTAWAIRSAARVEGIMIRDPAVFHPDELLRTARQRTATMGPAVFMVTDESGRLVGAFSRRDILRPVGTRIVLVDHNELSQAVPGAEEVEILEVVDHHRLGDLRTQTPIFFLNRPVGSTCTIIADLFRQDGLEVSPRLAGVLMGGLVSDTLNLRSPTTTPVDARILGWLEEIAGVSGAQLAERIFSSGSVIVQNTPEQVVGMDRKLYQEGPVQFAVSQVEELGFGAFWETADALGDALEASCRAEGLTFAALLVTDVKSQDSLLLVRGDEEFIRRIPYPVSEIRETVFRADGVVSRKKQLLPFLLGILG
jgi:manganese-dependent inorganic pyrophosphatase